MERGWFPPSRVLLDLPKLRETMTERDHQNEKIIPYIIPLQDDTHFSQLSDLTSTTSISSPTSSSSSITNPLGLNLSGYVSELLMMLVSNEERAKFVETIKDRAKQGLSMKDKLELMKKITGGKLFKLDECNLSKSILEVQVDNERNKMEEVQTKISKKEMIH